MMTDIMGLCRWPVLLLAFAAAVLSSGSWAAEAAGSEAAGLVLDVYVDDAGKALVTGYAMRIDGLAFLNGSEYQYDEEARQLYAVTNSLTAKRGDDWEIGLSASGSYGEYHVTFYLSEKVQLTNITGTEGIDYLVSSSSESFLVEFHGYDVASPAATIRYRQPVGGGGAAGEALPPGGTSRPRLLLAGAVIVVLAVLGAASLGGWGKPRPLPPGEASAGAGPEEASGAPPAVSAPTGPPVPGSSPAGTGGARISGEMAAVMDTLTDRERSVLEALMKNEGKMTQADIRYETGIPKSSLTGIIVSLERRNIVTKKERGRTNVIELSERLNWGGGR